MSLVRERLLECASEDRQTAHWLLVPKSSGEIWSRNSRNFSTSSSCSSGIAIPASCQHAVAAVDRCSGAQRERYGVGRPGTDLHAAGEHQLRVEDALPQIRDADLRELLSDCFEYVFEKVMGQRARRSHALLSEGDRGRLTWSDPDGEVAVASHFTQEHDRLVGGHFHPDTHDVELVHTATLGRARPVWIVGARSVIAPGPPKPTAPGPRAAVRRAWRALAHWPPHALWSAGFYATAAGRPPARPFRPRARRKLS